MPTPEQEETLKVAMLTWLATCEHCDASLKDVMRGRPSARLALNYALKLRGARRLSDARPIYDKDTALLVQCGSVGRGRGALLHHY